MEGLGREGRQKGRTADPGSFILSLPFFPFRPLLQVPLRELSSLLACLPALKSCSSLFLCHKRKAGAEKEGGGGEGRAHWRSIPPDGQDDDDEGGAQQGLLACATACSLERATEGRAAGRPTDWHGPPDQRRRRSLAGCDASKRLRGRGGQAGRAFAAAFCPVPVRRGSTP